MTIKVIYFASLKEDIGRSEDHLEISTPQTVTDIWMQATGRSKLPDNLLIAVNHEYVYPDTWVQANDEVAFFPPVTGG